LIKTKGKRKGHLVISAVIVLAALIGFVLYRQTPRKGTPPEIQPSSEKKKALETEEVYRIAVIIDDVGYSSATIEEYLKFNGRLTFSVLPSLSRSREYAELLHRNGFEVMIHVPMEPISYPETDPGPSAILITDTKSDIAHKLASMIEENPFAKGANNHMGSKATQDLNVMRCTLEILKSEGFFWVDSLTTNASLGYGLAKELKLPATKRDVFLDNEDSFSYINSQFERLKQIAKQQGTAVGIGHITKKNTLGVLRYQLPLLNSQNFKLIHASEAVRN
jgi:polysaccharide deacetylase 2 family uncharacterized protein YibQ